MVNKGTKCVAVAEVEADELVYGTGAARVVISNVAGAGNIRTAKFGYPELTPVNNHTSRQCYLSYLVIICTALDCKP